MLSILSARFRRHIALFLYGVFYSQLIMAAKCLHREGDGIMTGYGVATARNVRVPERISLLPRGYQGVRAPLTREDADSLVVPGRHTGPLGNLESSPSFQPGARLLLSRTARPQAAGMAGAGANLADAAGVAAAKKGAFIGGPTQPESQSFKSVNSNNMVDLFSGDFSYNIPLLDVGGYPVNIAYHSGRSMDEDASWVGLGWNVNPGSITRNMRGLPDDFNGGTDTIKKVSNIKPNVTWGASLGGDFEIAGLPVPFKGSAGLFHTTYNGWGMETALNASLNVGDKSAGSMAGGLSLTNNSQNGLTLAPSLSFQYAKYNSTNNGGGNFGVSISAPYNSRTGLKDIALGFSASVRLMNKNVPMRDAGISFSWPTYIPTISMPMTNNNFSFTVKTGGESTVFHPDLFLRGYCGSEYIAAADTVQSIPAYGYMNFQNRGGNWAALTDFNREKEMPYRENPAIPHIAVPAYTYDIFSISGEGTGGMFRAYRGDIGFIADHLIGNKTLSGDGSVDLGIGNIVHGGVDLNANYSTTTTGPWLSENLLKNSIGFQGSNGLYEAAYFRNPGEKAINTTAFYNAIGGDNVVAASLYQPGNSGPSILATNILNCYNNKLLVGTDTLTPASAVRTVRDKRAQSISYLTAAEASVVGLDKYINHYAVNQFQHYCENDVPPDPVGNGTGLTGYYFANEELAGTATHVRQDPYVFFNWYHNASPFNINYDGLYNGTDPSFPKQKYSVRWLGRLKAPATGRYSFGTYSDDGVRLWIDDTLEINNWTLHGVTWDTCSVYLVAGTMYNIRLEYFQNYGYSVCQFAWRRPDQPTNFGASHQYTDDGVPTAYLYPPIAYDTIAVNPGMTQEDRVNTFRKTNHISEVDVLNEDGRRYVYGIPVYNLVQKEVSFSVNSDSGNVQTGMTAYSAQDNSTNNNSGKDGYYSREEIPAYAHSFLLTGILSPDYVDVTGDGISDDDIGDAVKFTYSKTSGIANPYSWRAPYVTDSANYNEGLRSYDRDDKGNYIYGTKELWYLHTIESKTMVATFTLQPRSDLLEIDEKGNKVNNGKAMCLKQIDLYSKADLLQHDTLAVPIKTVHFEYSYTLCRGVNQPVNDSGKLTLTRIWFTYNNNNKGVLNPYVFNYHQNNPRYKVNSADKWGAYKDASQNAPDIMGSAPGVAPLSNEEYPYSLQNPATAAYNAGAWALDSIQLPSGGRIKVNYESNDYAYVQNRRSTQMMQIAGIGMDASGTRNNRLYNFFVGDGLYVYVHVPYAPSSLQDLYARYLDGITKLYFRLNVKMPTDEFGSGSEYIPCYADPDTTATSWYGIVNSNTIWIKVKGVDNTGNGSGVLSPLAQTAINYLRLNLPSKAYPGSEINDNLSLEVGIKLVLSMVNNVSGMLSGFTNTARGNGWASIIDTLGRSLVRLDCPTLKKLGGGSRVQSILIYDNWNAMTGNKETVYGQTYQYTTTQSVNGVTNTISSGVATWEPVIGGEENPFHLPIEYVDRVSLLAPASLQYTEEPLGETFYPAPSVGYSKVRVRSIHTTGTRSSNGNAETTFYTSYDFPTSWDWTLLDNNSKKRYKPILSNLLRINSRNYLTLSQGFKVELNDMNGKMRSEATYAETDSVHPITYTENFYKVDNQTVLFKHLNNTVTTIDPQGNIDTAAMIGKDAELMADMRDQTSTSIGGNINVNGDLFTAGLTPVDIPSLLNLYQRETNQFRSVAMMKVIQRYGILDSVVHIDKGSRISSKNLLYDAETGAPLLVRTQNEFNDSLYEFNYPSHWAYTGVGPAYQNIDALLPGLSVNGGKIQNGLPVINGVQTADTTFLTAGDELLVYSDRTIQFVNCDSSTHESFPESYKLWVVDTSLVNGGTRSLYLVDQYGTPFSGNHVTLKVTRSGHRNVGGSVGSVTSLANPLRSTGMGSYHLVFDTTTHVLSAGAAELNQLWRVEDRHTSNIQTSCIYTPADSALAAAEGASCLKPLFNYLIAYHLLFIPATAKVTVGSLVNAANRLGYTIDTSACPILTQNENLPFYSLTWDPNGNMYMAALGNDIIDLRSLSGMSMPLYSMVSGGTDSLGRVIYKNPGAVIPPPKTDTVNIYPGFTANLISTMGSSCPSTADSLMQVDSVSDHLLVENSLNVYGYDRNAISILRFDYLNQRVPANATILSANLILQADLRGHIPGLYDSANSVYPQDSVGYSLSAPAGWFPYQPIDTMLYQAYYTNWFAGIKNSTPFQNDTVNVLSYLNGYLSTLYPSSTFVLTQGSGGLHATQGYDSTMVANDAVPPYLMSGFGNYYSTYYSQRYSDPTKWPVMHVIYVEPQPFADTLGAVLEFNSTMSCTTVYGRSCYSAITDTLVNPYQYALLGDYRPLRSYVYYGRRMQSDPTQATNIRTNGVINNFAPFWVLSGGHWAPAYDTTRWVWNSQTTLFNRKGFELENMDPLGRFNAGIYGYGLTLPTAVIQNGHYQESAFEGFEDYGFSTTSCDQTCTETRPFDFTAFENYISDSTAHTGMYSLRIPKDSTVNLIGITIAASPVLSVPVFKDSLTSDACLTTRMNGMKASAGSVLPSFSPFAGKKMLVGAWVKEADSCSCHAYSNDHILINFYNGTTSVGVISMSPSGNMIEGWQRYESVLVIPSNANNMTLTLQASDSATTYFDDIRILPFNAEMKSYVYDPVSLRLMAEMDENNYATFYEYDDDGTLVRVKKETERGIQTIKETHSALLKNQ